ncbi:hypothetical protein M409DRAFT_33459, partial [Zasmidium cellare ATCC 36951]
RRLHTSSAKLVTINAKGVPEYKAVSIWLGGINEAFALVPIAVGEALRTMPNQSGRFPKPDTHRLTFDHSSQAFMQVSAPYPRLVLDRDLPRQSDRDTSPATLFCFAATYTIALDGTAD